mgnify:FL=1
MAASNYTLYHCKNSRSLRPLWALEELGVAYTLHTLPFPPRVLEKSYLEINALGTVPCLIDGETRLTESAAMCHYLAVRHAPETLAVPPDAKAYGAFLNWLYFSDATLTFPQTLVLRYTVLEPDRGLKEAAEDYAAFFAGRLKAVEAALDGRSFLVADRFTVADVCVGYGVYLASLLAPLKARITPNAAAYLDRLMARPAFQRAVAADSSPA